MSDKDTTKNILEEILNILTLLLEKKEKNSVTFFNIIPKKDIKTKFAEINFEDRVKPTFETDGLYRYLLMKIMDFLTDNTSISFNSEYSIINFKRIVFYLKSLLKSNINILDDILVKIFLYLLFFFFEDKLEIDKKNNSQPTLELEESFFKGSFIELTGIYSTKVPYVDPKEIEIYLKKVEEKAKINISSLVNATFEEIKYKLKLYGLDSDILIKNMYDEAGKILYELDQFEMNQSKNISTDYNLPNNLINKIKEFYSKKEYLIFINYISEVNEDDIENKIDSEFLKSIEENYSNLEFNYNTKKNNGSIVKLNEYKTYEEKYYKRMKYCSLKNILEFDLNDEVNIFALSEFNIKRGFSSILDFKNKLEQINQNNISNMIKEILNDNNFYKKYFSILRTDIVKNFFISYLSIDDKNNEFKLNKNKTEDSECFEGVYSDFLNKYDKIDENYKEFKDLLILKILPSEDRAYTVRELEKIVINPSQFFLGNNIDEKVDIKMILKGYLMVILLHETQHFFRIYNKTYKSFSADTPKSKEGGKYFIKYLFDVLTINHIDLTQSQQIFDEKNWEDSKKLKAIFSGQLEDYEEGYINKNFLKNFYPNSISFFSLTKKYKNERKTRLHSFLKK